MPYGIELARSEIWHDPPTGAYPDGYDKYEWTWKALIDANPVGWFYARQMVITNEGAVGGDLEAVPYLGIQTRFAGSHPDFVHLNGRKVVLFSAWGGTGAAKGSGPNEGTFASAAASSEDFELDSYGASAAIDFDWQVGEKLTLDIQREIANILTAHQADFEGTGFAGINNGSSLVALDTTWSAHGSKSLKITCNGGALPNAGTDGGTNGVPVLPNTEYTCSAVMRQGATARNYYISITWYDSGGVQIGSTVNGSTVASTTSGVRVSLTATSPSGAAFCAVRGVINATPPNGEEHWIDKVMLAPGAIADWAPAGSYRFKARVKGDQHGDIWYTVGTITGEGNGYPSGGGNLNGRRWNALSQYSVVWDEYYGFGNNETCSGFGHTIVEWGDFLGDQGAGYVVPDHIDHYWGLHDPFTVCLATIADTSPTTFTHESGQAVGTSAPEQPPASAVGGHPVIPDQKGFTYLFCDIFTDEIIAELPLRNVRFTSKHKKAGEARAIIQLGSREVEKLNWLEGTAPAQTALYIDYRGRLVWGGPVWGRFYNGENSTLDLVAAEWISFYERQFINPPIPPPFNLMVFNNVDQFEIFRQIIATVTEQAGGDIGLLVDSTLMSGVKRKRTYWGYEHKNVYEALFQLSEVINGFEFRIHVEWNGDRPRKRLILGYPMLGSRWPAADLMFDMPGNMTGYDYPEDATRYLTSAHAVGAGEGTSQLHVHETDDAAIAGGMPLLEDVYSYKDIVRLSTLQEHAAADLKYRSIMTGNFPVRLSFDSPLLGTYFVGDDCQVRVSDPRFPRQADGSPGLVVNKRVMEQQVQVDSGLVTLQVGEVWERT